MRGRVWHPDPIDPPVPTQPPLPAIAPDDFEVTDERHHWDAARTAAVWDALERHARALDRSDAAHHLRVRAEQAAGQQRHVRAAVSHFRRAVGA